MPISQMALQQNQLDGDGEMTAWQCRHWFSLEGNDSSVGQVEVEPK